MRTQGPGAAAARVATEPPSYRPAGRRIRSSPDPVVPFRGVRHTQKGQKMSLKAAFAILVLVAVMITPFVILANAMIEPVR